MEVGLEGTGENAERRSERSGAEKRDGKWQIANGKVGNGRNDLNPHFPSTILRTLRLSAFSLI